MTKKHICKPVIVESYVDDNLIVKIYCPICFKTIDILYSKKIKAEELKIRSKQLLDRLSSTMEGCN